MTPAEFIAKWQASTRNERAACQEHFVDLCHLLGEATPNSDPTGEDYAFEKGATRFTGQAGWADVWRRNRFAWEYKKQRGDLDAAYRQLLLYQAAEKLSKDACFLGLATAGCEFARHFLDFC